MTIPLDSPDVESNVRDLIRWVISGAGFAGQPELLAQVDVVTVAGGPITMLDLNVPRSAPLSTCPDGPLPTPAFVHDCSGQPVGELLVWVSEGYLAGLEFAWWTDQAPTVLPGPEQLTGA